MQHDQSGNSNFGQFSVLQHCPYSAFYPLSTHPTLENEASGAHTLISGNYSTTTGFGLHDLLHAYLEGNLFGYLPILIKCSLIVSCASLRMSDGPTVPSFLPTYIHVKLRPRSVVSPDSLVLTCRTTPANVHIRLIPNSPVCPKPIRESNSHNSRANCCLVPSVASEKSK
jgi:hypothetical protein